MAARDLFHQAVVSALQKEGWVIPHDQLAVPIGGSELTLIWARKGY